MEGVHSVRISAIDRINRLPITAYHRRLIWILGFVFFFEYADINTLSFASPAIMRSWNIPIGSVATLVSATFIGMFAGSTFGGWFADRVGRKRALIWTTVWYAGFSLLNAFAWNSPSLFVSRLLTGTGISAMIVVGITYISEMFPASVRGAYQGWIMAIGLCGVPVTAYVARFCIPMASWGWRLVFVWGSLGLFFPFFAALLEESPRWLEDHGFFEKADETLARIEREIIVKAGELPEPVKSGHGPVQEVNRSYISELFVVPHLGRTTLLVVAWIFGSLGFFGFTSWVPTLLVARGFSLVHSLTWSSAMATACIPGAMLAASISDKFDRKWSILTVTMLIAICGVCYGTTCDVAAIVIFGILVEMLIHTFTPLMYAYTAESFPSAIRTSGTGVAYGAGRLANVFGPFIVAFIFKRYGYMWVFVYIALAWVAAGLVVGVFGPRSKRLA
jgi:putative MFS transporter